jgi:hypothetical protein
MRSAARPGQPHPDEDEHGHRADLNEVENSILHRKLCHGRADDRDR